MAIESQLARPPKGTGSNDVEQTQLSFAGLGVSDSRPSSPRSRPASLAAKQIQSRSRTSSEQSRYDADSNVVPPQISRSKTPVNGNPARPSSFAQMQGQERTSIDADSSSPRRAYFPQRRGSQEDELAVSPRSVHSFIPLQPRSDSPRSMSHQPHPQNQVPYIPIASSSKSPSPTSSTHPSPFVDSHRRDNLDTSSNSRHPSSAPSSRQNSEGSNNEQSLSVSTNSRKESSSSSGEIRERVKQICSKCGLPIPGQFVRALGTVFHLDCFKCQDCGKVVAAKFFPVDSKTGEQYPLCETDYFRRLNLLCAKCGGALRGSYITALGPLNQYLT